MALTQDPSYSSSARAAVPFPPDSMPFEFKRQLHRTMKTALLERIQYVQVKGGKWLELTDDQWRSDSSATLAFAGPSTIKAL
jgi:hypothetical protein